MKATVAAGAVWIALALPALAAAPDLQPAVFPSNLPSAAVLAGWEYVRGRGNVAADSVSYEMYVDPERQAMYVITRFSMERQVQTPAGLALRVYPETLLYNARPGERVPLLSYERVGAGWKALTPGTPEYHASMMGALFVYDVHRRSKSR